MYIIEQILLLYKYIYTTTNVYTTMQIYIQQQIYMYYYTHLCTTKHK